MVMYTLRFDAYDDRANVVIKYHPKRGENALEELSQLTKINDEPVLFVGKSLR